MKKIGFWLCLSLVFAMVGCQLQQSEGILVLADKVENQNKYVVNGGPGSTEASFTDENGKEWKISSNTVRVPIQEECKRPDLPPDVLKPIEYEPQVGTAIAVNTYNNQVLIASEQKPFVYHDTSAFVPQTPPKIKLIKSADQDILCCDQDLTFRIRYINEGGSDAYNIRIWDEVPANVEYIEETAAGDPFFANIEVMRGEDEKVKRITWIVEGPIPPGEEGEVYYSVTCPQLRPRLSCFLAFNPTIIPVGEQGTVNCKVINSGTGPAKDVKLKINIPANVEHEGESNGKELILDLGEIAAGATADKEFTIKVLNGGKQDSIVANVIAENSEGCECVVPPTPSLSIEKTGPARTNNSEKMVYTIVVRNTSTKDAPATNCVLTDKLPNGVKFVSASEEGAFDEAANVVTWNLGNLMPGAIVTREIAISPQRSGNFRDEAEVSCAEGIRVTDDAITIVEGYAAMHISKYDTEDPVGVGETTTYMIEVRNEGFKDATGVILENEFPELTEFVEAKGTGAKGEVLDFQVEGNKVIFSALPILESGEKAIYSITVKAVAKGQLLNRSGLRYNEFSKTIIVEEPTTSYE